MTKAVMHFDGSYDWKTKRATGGCVIRIGAVRHTRSWKFGETTMNGCEFLALIRGVEFARELGVESLLIFGDSKLVVMVLRKKWKAKKPHIKQWRADAFEVLGCMKWSIKWIPRHKNEEADFVSRPLRKRERVTDEDGGAARKVLTMPGPKPRGANGSA